jgi:outer membrane protein assembly factor BamB
MRAPFFLLLASTTASLAADWPQWRGPDRNGVAPDSPALLEKFPEDGPQVLWESEPIPASDDGGLGSPVAAGGKVFLSLVWHRQEPSETRQIDELVLRQLGYQNTKNLPAELIKKIEDTRAELPPTLRGKKLEEFTTKFVEENLDPKQRQLFTSWVSKRFKAGKLAIPLTVFDALAKHQNHVFANDAEMRKWLDDQGWSEPIKEQIVAAVSPTKRVAEDAVICLDLATGKTLWKTVQPGNVVGFDGSSTPSVVGDRVYALCSQRLWCLNVKDGSVVWEAPLKNERRGLGSSPLVTDGIVLVNAGRLTAFDAENGKPLWTQEKAGGLHASPTLWRGGESKLALINGKALTAVNLSDGKIAWSVPAGGDSTPAVSGDLVVTQSFNAELGLVAYRVSPTGAEKVWNYAYPGEVLRTQSSPLIHQDRVYLFDDNNHHCLDLKSGSRLWFAKGQSTISSPVIADGKILALTNNGNTLVMLATGTSDPKELGRATVRAQWVPSPCIADGKLVLRMKDKLKAWNLAR